MDAKKLDSIKEYYDKIHGSVPLNENQAIEKVCKIYQEVMNVQELTVEIRQGIAEKYRLLNSHNLPAYYWLVEAIYVTSKKKPEKRTFKYLVGILKGWQRSGFGYSPSSEEAEIMDYIAEQTGIELGLESRKLLRTLLASYGLIKMTRIISQLKVSDGSFALALYLAELLRKNFGELSNLEDEYVYSDQPLVQQSIQENNYRHDVFQTLLSLEHHIPYLRNSHEAIKQELPPLYENSEVAAASQIQEASSTSNSPKEVSVIIDKQKAKGQKTTTKSSKYPSPRKILKEAKFVENIIAENASPMRSSEIFKRLEEKHKIVLNQRTHTSKMKSYMGYNSNIVKIGTGLYATNQMVLNNKNATEQKFIEQNETIDS